MGRLSLQKVILSGPVPPSGRKARQEARSDRCCSQPAGCCLCTAEEGLRLPGSRARLLRTHKPQQRHSIPRQETAAPRFRRNFTAGTTGIDIFGREMSCSRRLARVHSMRTSTSALVTAFLSTSPIGTAFITNFAPLPALANRQIHRDLAAILEAWWEVRRRDP